MVSSLIGGSSQERIHNVAMSSMQLDSVESCLFRQLNTFLKLILEGRNIFQGHFFWYGELFSVKISNGFSDCYCGRSPNFWIIVFERVCYSASVENLQEEETSLGMHGVENQLPSFHLLSIIEAGRSQEPVSSLTPRSRLGQDKSGSCPLSVVFGDQRSRDIGVDVAPLSSECSHQYSIFEGQRSQANRVTPIFLHFYC